MPKRATSDVKLKRAYDTAARSDGRRILVDRIWPRGIARAELRIADWIKDAAPSAGLRKLFGHEPARWPEFKRRYFQELDRRLDRGSDGAFNRLRVLQLGSAQHLRQRSTTRLRRRMQRPEPTELTRP